MAADHAKGHALDEAIDELYALPLDAFTKARGERAKGAATPGERARIKAIPKPSRAAWTLDRLARDEHKLIASLFSAGEALKKAQGGGERARIQEATRSLRARLAEVAKHARALGANAATLHRLNATVQAALVDDEVRALVVASRLATDVEVEGFGALAGTKVAAPRAAATPSKPARAHPGDVKANAKKAREAQAAREKAEREAARAEQRRLREEAAKRRAAAREEHEKALAEAHLVVTQAEKELAAAKAKLRALQRKRP